MIWIFGMPTLIQSDMRMAKMTYDGFLGFNPLLGMVRGGGLNLPVFSVFRLGNEAPQEHNVGLVLKNIRFLKVHLPKTPIVVRSDSAGYNHRLMKTCDREGVGFDDGRRFAGAGEKKKSAKRFTFSVRKKKGPPIAWLSSAEKKIKGRFPRVWVQLPTLRHQHRLEPVESRLLLGRKDAWWGCSAHHQKLYPKSSLCQYIVDALH